MMTLNTIVAEAFDSLAEELSSFAPETFLSQLQETLKRRISEHKRIIFNGDNYSEEWVKEAGTPRPSQPEKHDDRPPQPGE